MLPPPARWLRTSCWKRAARNTSRGPVDLAGGEQRTEAYLKLNPQGRVPVLGLDDGTPLAENTAILPYLGKRFGLWPTDPLAEAKASLHDRLLCRQRASGPRPYRPPRALRGPTSAAYPTIKEMGRKTFPRLSPSRSTASWRDGKWLSDRFSVLDPYGLVFYPWGVRRELPMAELSNYTAFKDRMLKRPAVQRVVEDEKVKV